MLTAGTQIGNYTVDGLLAEGGMALVFKARHSVLGSLHAIKVLRTQLAQHADIRKRFLDEGRIMARLRHPNITPVTDVVVAEGVAGLVMPLMKGEDLEVRLSRDGPQTLAVALAWTRQLLRALAWIHSHNVVHRDLKPANLFLERLPDGDDELRLLDFGIAKVEDRTQSATRSGYGTMGSMAYMSPEQLRDAKDVDKRSDLFVVGMLLYEMLAGRSPFQGDSDFDTQMNIAQGKYEPLRTIRPALPEVIDNILAKTITRDREKRPRTAEQLLAALARVDRPAPAPAPAPAAAPAAAPARPSRPAPRRASHRRTLRPVIDMVDQERIELVQIEAGSFIRGEDGSSPPQQIELTRPLLVHRTAVSQGLWEAVMGTLPGQEMSRMHPVTEVSWFDCVRFCNALSERAGLPPAYAIGEGRTPVVRWGRSSTGFRLLTEAEWEYVARSGQQTRYAGNDDFTEVGWFAENTVRPAMPSVGGTRRRSSASRNTSNLQPMSRRAANGWGLYDLSGNAWEWVWDHGAPFPAGDLIDPTGPDRGTTRVSRGGSFRSKAADATLSARRGAHPSDAADDRGLRIVRYRTAEDETE